MKSQVQISAVNVATLLIAAWRCCKWDIPDLAPFCPWILLLLRCCCQCFLLLFLFFLSNYFLYHFHACCNFFTLFCTDAYQSTSEHLLNAFFCQVAQKQCCFLINVTTVFLKTSEKSRQPILLFLSVWYCKYLRQKCSGVVSNAVHLPNEAVGRVELWRGTECWENRLPAWVAAACLCHLYYRC